MIFFLNFFFLFSALVFVSGFHVPNFPDRCRICCVWWKSKLCLLAKRVGCLKCVAKEWREKEGRGFWLERQPRTKTRTRIRIRKGLCPVHPVLESR